MTQALNDSREVLLLLGKAHALWRLEEMLRQQREERLLVEREMERIRRPCFSKPAFEKWQKRLGSMRALNMSNDWQADRLSC